MAAVDSATARRVLDLPLPEGNDADAPTVRDYLIKLLRLVWEDEQSFDGKRPFGNSGWQYDVYVPMIRAGLVAGTLDEYDGPNDDFEYRDADRLILAAIDELGKAAT